MTKQPSSTGENSPPPATTWTSVWGLLIPAMASLLLAGVVWIFVWRLLFPGWFPAAGWAGLLVLIPLLVIALERTLAALAIERVWRLRLPFIIAAGLLFIGWAGYYFVFGTVPDWSWLVWATGAAFLGGLLATALESPLWENNSPPPDRLQADVLLVHQRVIGAPDHVPLAKRGFDLLLASLGCILATPVWLLIAILIWLEDPGPLFFVKNSVGRGGANFRQLKFRTMVSGAEDSTGPVLAREEDDRILLIGRLLRKTALDELPQLVNILAGEMSFVGPRPQRTVLVNGYLQAMPEYAERHLVLPGLAGLAQVAGDYYLTPRQKLRLDRLYIRYTSLGFDLKLIGLAFLIAFWYRWKPGWNGRLPRKFLHSRR